MGSTASLRLGQLLEVLLGMGAIGPNHETCVRKRKCETGGRVGQPGVEARGEGRERRKRGGWWGREEGWTRGEKRGGEWGEGRGGEGEEGSGRGGGGIKGTTRTAGPGVIILDSLQMGRGQPQNLVYNT